MKKEITEIKSASGIAIVLVVYGHMLVPGMEGLKWYVESREVIYLFHMCFFIFLSGFLLGHTSLSKYTRHTFSNLVKKKIKKFAPPYILFSIIFLVLENTFGVGEWSNFLHDITNMIFYPRMSPAGFLWYLYVLLFFYILTPLVNYFSKKNYQKIILISFVIYFIKVPSIFALDQISEYLLFYSLGLYFSQNYIKFFNIISKIGFPIILFFAVLIYLRNYTPFPKLFLGLGSIPALVFLAITFKNNLLFQRFGKYSYQIYLMNSIVIGTFATILFKYLKYQPSFIIVVLLFTSGLFLPIITYKYIIKKVHFLNIIIH